MNSKQTQHPVHVPKVLTLDLEKVKWKTFLFHKESGETFPPALCLSICLFLHFLCSSTDKSIVNTKHVLSLQTHLSQTGPATSPGSYQPLQERPQSHRLVQLSLH